MLIAPCRTVIFACHCTSCHINQAPLCVCQHHLHGCRFRIHCLGHSLGGGVAALATYLLRSTPEFREQLSAASGVMATGVRALRRDRIDAVLQKRCCVVASSCLSRFEQLCCWCLNQSPFPLTHFATATCRVVYIHCLPAHKNLLLRRLWHTSCHDSRACGVCRQLHAHAGARL